MYNYLGNTMKKIHFRSYSQLAETVHKNLETLTPYGFDLIVGVPRSGMIPAYMIGLDLNLPVCSLRDLIDDNNIKRIATRIVKNGEIEHPSQAKKILLVEDSYNTGSSLKATMSSINLELRKKITTLAVYTSQPTQDLDIYFEILRTPRAFEWNIMNHNKFVDKSCFDMDGVLCEDPTDKQNDDGKEYLKFIKNAKPKYIPRYPIKSIVTSRLEKYRKPTEEWLKKHGVEYEQLIMLSGYTAEERRKLGLHTHLKSKEYKKSEYDLFYESDYRQSIIISNNTSKPVYWVGGGEMIYPKQIQETSAKTWRNSLKQRSKDNAVVYALLKHPYRVYKLVKRSYND